MTTAWNPAGTVLPAQTSARSAAVLAQAPSATDVGLGPQVLYFDPDSARPDYFAVSRDGKSYVKVGTTDNPRGPNVLLLGGSETARGNCIIPCEIGAVQGDGGILLVTTKVSHGLHSNTEVTLSSESAIAPDLNSGIVTFDNTFAYGKITVTSAVTFSMPYIGMPGTSGYEFEVCAQKLPSPNGKFTELNRRLGGQLNLVANFGTGSNNTANLVGRIPLIVSMILAGVVTEVRGALGIGNTLIYGNNHGWTLDQIDARLRLDIPYMVRSIAAAGGRTTVDLPAVQLGTDGFGTTGLRLAYEICRELAADPNNRMRLLDEFALFVDPSTGIGRTRYYRGGDGSDPTHPSNEGVVMHSYHHVDDERAFYPHQTERLMRSALDCNRADSSSSQLMDGFLAGDNTIDSAGLDSKATGMVPTSIEDVVTTGSGGRSIVFSYVARPDGCGFDLYADISGAANDTFTILIANPSPRQLKFLAEPGKRYYAGMDYACVPGTAVVKSVDAYLGMTATYGVVTSKTGYLTADCVNFTLFPDGPLAQPRIGGNCMPEFDMPAGITNVQDLALAVTVTLNSTGTATLRIGRPTLRQLN